MGLGDDRVLLPQALDRTPSKQLLLQAVMPLIHPAHRHNLTPFVIV